MSKTSVGVANHPAKDQMESLWREGWRAAPIIEWLEEQGLPVVSASVLGRYGQRYWTDVVKVNLECEDLEDLQQRIHDIEGMKVGSIRKVTVRSAVLASGSSTSSQTIDIVPNGSTKNPIQQAPSVKVKLSFQKEAYRGKGPGWRQGAFLPDMQIGYFNDNGTLTTTHDEAAIDVAHQILAACEQKYGIDLVVNAGDNLDFPAFSSHRSPPGFLQTSQQAINRASEEAAIQRAIAQNARIVWFEGNHECLDDQTMAMTPDGPVPYTEVSVGDLVLSCADDLTAEWVPIEAVHEYDFDGEMIRIGAGGKNRVDMLVTPNHRVVGFPVCSWETKGKMYWREQLARDYVSTCIPTAFLSGNDEMDISDNEIRLLAWCLTDSYITEGDIWYFYQSGDKAERIRTLLSDLGLSCYEKERHRDTKEICGKTLKKPPLPSFEFRVTAEDSRVICKLIDNKSFMPQALRLLSDRQFDVFLEEMVFTDGTLPTSTAGSRVIYSSGPMKADIQRECIRHGWSCTLTEYRPDHWRLNLTKKLATRMEKQFVTRENYVGKVWCLTVPRGRFVAYRNNKPFLTGNSRLTNYLTDKATPVLALSRAGEDQPVVSVPHLCRFEDYDVEFLGPYPDTEFWVNDHFRLEHGSLYSSTPGGTAAKHLKNGVSVGHGHTHRVEYLQETRHTPRGPRTHFAGSPGCLCRIDGAVPSAKTGITAKGKQAKQKSENWQQGLWLFKYQPEGDQLVTLDQISIWGGWAQWEGVDYFARVDVDGVPLVV